MASKNLYLGQIFRLPPGATDLEDLFAHYHLLVKVHPHDHSATFLFGTGSATEQSCGAPTVVVPRSNQNNLTKTTYFYGPVLAVTPLKKLGGPSGDVSSRETEIKKVVREALGCGTGTANAQRAVAESLRGMVVQFKPKYETIYRTKYCTILTKHGYSVRNSYQIFAPLYDVKPQTANPVASVPMPPALTGLFAKGAANLYAPASHHSLSVE